MTDLDGNRIACLALKEYGLVGPRLFQHLLLTYGSPTNIFNFSAEELSAMTNIDLAKARRIIEAGERLIDLQDTLDEVGMSNIHAVSYVDDDYPEALRRIAEPPLAIYVKGEVGLLQKGGVAIVGTTVADQDGIRLAVKLAQLSTEAHQTVISGLAAGIDSAAHLGCLKAGGKTLAVLGCGHLNIYPDENIPLAGLIAEAGIVISEYESYADPIPRRLVARNRLIAALADAVVVVQIGEAKKGELHAARAALEQGKPVFVVDPDGKYSSEPLLNNQAITIGGSDQFDEVLKYMIR